MTDHLLPPNATTAERQTSLAAGIRYEAVPIPHRTLWDPWTCDADLLPWLAWAVSTDDWDPRWPEVVRRRVVADAIAIHRRKGTPWAVRYCLEQLGFRDVEILEGTSIRYAGAYAYDGTITYGDEIGPYEFDVLLNSATAVLPGSDALIFGGTAWGTGTGTISGGDAADPGEGLLAGGNAEAATIPIGEITEAMRAEILRRIDTYKNERSKLRTLYSYSLFYDGTHDYGDTSSVSYNGGIIE